MAKRFTDTSKWNKPFLRGMKAPYKLLWLYILDECDHAGIWQVDFDVAQLKIGEKLNIDQARNFFSGRIIEINSGEKWFVFDFIDFQYGELNPENRAHNSVIKILTKLNIDYENKPLVSPLQGRKDKDKDMDMDMDMDKDKETAPKIFYRTIKHLKLSFEDFDKLINEGWSKQEVDGILDEIENYKQNTKYAVLLTTARNWLRNSKNKNNGNQQQTKYPANHNERKASVSALGNAAQELLSNPELFFIKPGYSIENPDA